MGHVIDEIILDFTEFFLSEHGPDGKVKSSDDNDGKKNGSNDIAPEGFQYNILIVGYGDTQHFVSRKVFPGRTAWRHDKYVDRIILYAVIVIGKILWLPLHPANTRFAQGDQAKFKGDIFKVIFQKWFLDFYRFEHPYIVSMDFHRV